MERCGGAENGALWRSREWGGAEKPNEETEPMQDERYEESIRLLEDTCNFPCEFQFKIIGSQENDFVQRVVTTVQVALHMQEEPAFRTRETPNGRHVSVTLEPLVTSAADVLKTYQRLRDIEGVVMLL
jgi:putative lipoic acid-binding regulatory protein